MAHRNHKATIYRERVLNLWLIEQHASLSSHNHHNPSSPSAPQSWFVAQNITKRHNQLDVFTWKIMVSQALILQKQKKSEKRKKKEKVLSSSCVLLPVVAFFSFSLIMFSLFQLHCKSLRGSQVHPCPFEREREREREREWLVERRMKHRSLFIWGAFWRW